MSDVADKRFFLHYKGNGVMANTGFGKLGTRLALLTSRSPQAGAATIAINIVMDIARNNDRRVRLNQHVADQITARLAPFGLRAIFNAEGGGYPTRIAVIPALPVPAGEGV